MTNIKNTNNPNIYDACFIVFNILANDARTLNHARSLVKFGKKVIIAAMSNEKESDLFKNDRFDFIRISDFTNLPVWKRLSIFNEEVTKHFGKLGARTYWAEDFYSLFAATKLKRMYGGKLFYDSREIYSALGPLYNHPLKQMIISLFELHLIKKVDEFIVTGRLDAEFLKVHFNSKKPFRIIMNLPFYREKIKTNILREKFNIAENKKIIIYQGMLLEGRGLLKIVQAMQFLPDFYFCILGEGSFLNRIIAEAKSLGVEERVIYCGFVNYDELHEYISSADIGTVLIEPISFSYQLALPNKLFECCNAGIPVISSDLPAMRDILEKFPFGELVPYNGSPQIISETILKLCSENNYEKYKQAAIDASKEFCYETQEWILKEMTKE